MGVIINFFFSSLELAIIAKSRLYIIDFGYNEMNASSTYCLFYIVKNGGYTTARRYISKYL